jgi:hypothetical protein
MVLDGVELGEGALDALLGLQHVVDVLDRHAVGVQRPFEIGAGAILDGAPAGEVLDVEEVGDRLGCLSSGNISLLNRNQVE